MYPKPSSKCPRAASFQETLNVSRLEGPRDKSVRNSQPSLNDQDRGNQKKTVFFLGPFFGPCFPLGPPGPHWVLLASLELHQINLSYSLTNGNSRADISLRPNLALHKTQDTRHKTPVTVKRLDSLDSRL